jgi:hypothetical protein
MQSKQKYLGLGVSYVFKLTTTLIIAQADTHKTSVGKKGSRRESINYWVNNFYFLSIFHLNAIIPSLRSKNN